MTKLRHLPNCLKTFWSELLRNLPLSMRKSYLYKIRTYPLMEAEHINQIGAKLADLATRTEDLRRYL